MEIAITEARSLDLGEKVVAGFPHRLNQVCPIPNFSYFNS